MRQRRREPDDVAFTVTDGILAKTVHMPDGRSYVHRCTQDVYREVAWAIENHAATGVTMSSLAESTGAPYTQVNVALEFMKEHGCVDVRRRRSFPASGELYEDAMTEFMALAEGAREVSNE